MSRASLVSQARTLARSALDMSGAIPPPCELDAGWVSRRLDDGVRVMIPGQVVMLE
jgi:hypothetical protein